MDFKRLLLSFPVAAQLLVAGTAAAAAPPKFNKSYIVKVQIAGHHQQQTMSFTLKV